MSFLILRTKDMKHVRGLLRAAGYLSVTMIAFSAYSIKAARAEMKQTSLSIGRDMLQYVQATHHSVTPMSVNGQMMYLGSSVSDDAVDTVLDKYDDACKKDPGQPHLGWKDVPLPNEAGGNAKRADAPDLVSKGVMRSGVEGKEGSVLCFMRGEETKPSTQEAWTSFMQTGELGALGKVRYVYAKKTNDGRTLVLTAWTESKFNLNDMIPEEGKDSAGADFPQIPRVPNSVRALSAHAEGRPYGVNVYKTTDSPAQTLAFYDKHMVTDGWRGVAPEMDPKEGYGHSYVKEGVVLTVGISQQKEGNFVALGLAGVGAESPSNQGDASQATPTVSR